MSLRQEIDTSLNVIKMICHCFVNLSSVDLEQKSRTLELCGLYLSSLFVFFLSRCLFQLLVLTP